MSGPASFLGVLARALDDAGVPYLLAGSFASSAHGAPRATQDIDLVIDPTFESLDRLLALLPSDRLSLDADVARDEFRRRGQFNVIDLDTGWKADLIFRKARRFSTTVGSRAAETTAGMSPSHGERSKPPTGDKPDTVEASAEAIAQSSIAW